MAYDLDQRLAFTEAELAAYRDENDRLARELVLARRVIDALPFPASAGSAEQPAVPRRLPRFGCTRDDIVFHIDRCDPMTQCVQIIGWAFCPEIDCGEASVSLLLQSPEETFLIQPARVRRQDVAAVYETIDLGPALLAGSAARSRLDQCGFSALLERAHLTAGRVYSIAIQIDGPIFSARRSTPSSLNV